MAVDIQYRTYSGDAPSFPAWLVLGTGSLRSGLLPERQSQTRSVIQTGRPALCTVMNVAEGTVLSSPCFASGLQPHASIEYANE